MMTADCDTPALKSAAHMSTTTETAAHMSEPTAPAARKRVRGESTGESGSRRQDDHGLNVQTTTTQGRARERRETKHF
jgi:hypothetical protein